MLISSSRPAQIETRPMVTSVAFQFAGLNVDSKLKPSDPSNLDEFEKTGAISDLLLEVGSRFPFLHRSVCKN